MELVIKDLDKKYSNGVHALNNVSLTIKKGMFGLLGPNGAGKSSLMRTLATLQDVDSGSVTLGDIDVLNDKQSVRKVLGYLPQEFGVYPRTSAVELLDHLALLKGFSNKSDRKEIVEQLLVNVNLWDHRKNAVSSYSGGMRQRFGIAQCLIGNPQLVIVDEPTAGLDPGERNRFYNILSEIGENTIVILSTHIVQDVRELCTQMAIMNKGQVLFSGDTDDALLEIRGKVWERKIAKHTLQDYQNEYKVISNKLVGGQPLIHIFSETTPGDGFVAAEENLEDVFFAKLNELV
ncbi:MULTISPECIES: ABC transporter ATP-binding protein [Flavobacterium]|uniref:ABC transporter ATP-binding protein n=1 Tax=Flavobacterium TaxID=237 RepID=UPI000869B626|nr:MULTISPECIES: ABC transporter ATP-binding protein [Flavobacterium]MBN9285650.1 ABC transporter ATP-binding protein [Flavobacterium sp.]ODS83719.1 MAG: multidrug ABC transporter ATP-binding protein [Chryseobacterium sp. SCN 40-13]OJV70543.1 MAG: multidrug ABC transporter ATP-binding protein [Flavobacterium sp. 40-81]